MQGASVLFGPYEVVLPTLSVIIKEKKSYFWSSSSISSPITYTHSDMHMEIGTERERERQTDRKYGNSVYIYKPQYAQVWFWNSLFIYCLLLVMLCSYHGWVLSERNWEIIGGFLLAYVENMDPRKTNENMQI